MSASGVVYLDSSAIVKLVRAEAESLALVAYLTQHSDRVSSALARTEVVRAAQTHDSATIERASAVIAGFQLIPLDDGILDDAGLLAPISVRSLDAIHLATARLLGPDLVALVTYDRRMAAAAMALNLQTMSPA